MIITPPELNLSSFKWRPSFNDIEGRSVFGSQVLRGSAPVWIVSMVGLMEYDEDAMRYEQFLEELDGLRNQVAIHHVGTPVPTGTLRGSLAVSVDVLAGAGTLVVDGTVAQAFKTLLKGDLIGIGANETQQVIRVKADCTADASGIITVPLNQPLRNAFDAGVEVRWDKPKALFRQTKANDGMEYTAGKRAQAFSLDLREDWRP